jgi:tetratricopeptide (TPR) repeat protein
LGLVLVFLVLVAYHEAPDNGFHMDDSTNITRHGPVRMQRFSLDGLRRAWEQPYLEHRPLPSLTFAIDWWRGGGEPRAFQWTNVATHAAVALVLMLFLREVLRAWKRGSTALSVDLAAACGAALWALHPIQVQAVCYIVQRMAAMATLFSILAVWLYLRGRFAGVPFRRYLYWLAALASLVLGLLSKEIAVLTLGLVLLLEIGLCRARPLSLRYRLDRVLLTSVVFALVAVVADLVVGGPLAAWLEPTYGARAFTLAERLMTQPRVIFFHLSQIALPLPSRFSIEHDFSLSTSLLTPATTLLAILGLCAWIGVGLRALANERSRLTGFFLLWPLVALSLESSILPLEILFEHRMYLPSAGIAGLAALGLHRVWCRAGWRAPLGAAVCLVLSALLAATLLRIPVWKDDISLYTHALHTAPLSVRVRTNLATEYLRTGQSEPAEEALRQALELDPDDRRALEMLGVLMLDRGELPHAERLFLRALQLYRSPPPHLLNHVGELYLQTGDLLRAEESFLAAEREASWNPNYQWNLAFVLERTDRCSEARVRWSRFLELAVDEARKEQVLDHLKTNYDSQGGTCFGRW